MIFAEIFCNIRFDDLPYWGRQGRQVDGVSEAATASDAQFPRGFVQRARGHVRGGGGAGRGFRRPHTVLRHLYQVAHTTRTKVKKLKNE